MIGDFIIWGLQGLAVYLVVFFVIAWTWKGVMGE